MTRYKLLKDIPLAPAGTEVWLQKKPHTNYSEIILEWFWAIAHIVDDTIPTWLEEIKEYKRWRAEKWKNYWCIDSVWYVDSYIDDNDMADNFRYSTYNYFKTKEQTQEYLDYITALATVNNKIDELNDGWEHNNELARYYIYYSNDEYGVDFVNVDWYISPLVIKYAKTEAISQQIIKDYKKELDIIFNYK